ncbi:MAG: hydroxyacylglutathione hydrolase [Clostridiales bacterium]|nr:hydroxyacylglutathione hydrolase [Clostridiales bacterium]MDN5299696.1 hydroxyacylglutathione hydrolase [Clostridiales bacterium]
MRKIHILGNTYCIDTGMTYIPYYKVNEHDIIMLDSGWGDGERDGIVELLTHEALHVIGIINSHAHIDHTGNNMFLKRRDGAIIAMSALEASICQSPISMKAYFGGHSLAAVEAHFGDMISDTDILIMPEDDRVTVCNTVFKVVHTPGHSPAHIAIITPDDVAYLGDAIISYEVMKGAKMPYAFILEEDLKSMAKLSELSCEHYIVAHKGHYDAINQLIQDNIEFYKHRAERVKEVITAPMTQEMLLKAVIEAFGIRIKSIHYQLVIERMMKSFLDYLVTVGEVVVYIDDGFIKYDCVKL